LVVLFCFYQPAKLAKNEDKSKNNLLFHRNTVKIIHFFVM